MDQALPEFRAFYEKYIPLIYRYIYSKVGNREEAEDLTSQVFLKALKEIDYTREQKSLQTWLFRVAQTTIADHWRAYYRLSVSSLEVLLETGWERPIEKEYVDLEQTPSQKVQQILAALPEKQREVLICRFLLNLPIKETAEAMHLTETNVKVLQFRALKHAAEFEQYLFNTRNKSTNQGFGDIL
jgi:RNA polymerase sigma-70 factor, ECF subfamily